MRRGDIELDRMKGTRLSHTGCDLRMVMWSQIGYRLFVTQRRPAVSDIGTVWTGKLCPMLVCVWKSRRKSMYTSHRHLPHCTGYARGGGSVYAYPRPDFRGGQAERIRRLPRFPPRECREESNRFGRRRVFPRVRRRIKERAN